MSEFIRMKKQGGIDGASQRLYDELDAELVKKCSHSNGEMQVVLLTYECLFPMRQNSYTGLTVLLTRIGDSSTAEIVGFGGGQGLFNVSMGANRKIAKMAAKVLQKEGFTPEEQVSV